MPRRTTAAPLALATRHLRARASFRIHRRICDRLRSDIRMNYRSSSPVPVTPYARRVPRTERLYTTGRQTHRAVFMGFAMRFCRSRARSDVQLFPDLRTGLEAITRERARVEAAVAARRDQAGERLPRPVGLHHAATAERVRLEHPRHRAPHDRAAIRRDLVQPGPSADVLQPLHRAHPREHPRPNLIQEKWLAVVIEVIARRLLGRRVSRQDVRPLVVKVYARGVDDHPVLREVGDAAVNDADLAANRLAPVPESEQLERERRPCAAGDHDRIRAQLQQPPGLGFSLPRLY